MAASYELHWDLPKKRLRFALHGMWDEQTLALWSREYKAAVLAAPAGGWTAHGDMTDHPAQGDVVQKGHEALIGFSFEHGMKKAVMVVPKAVIGMQMKRLASQAGAGTVFEYVTTAEEADRILDAVPLVG